jgi:hypothetical protein
MNTIAMVISQKRKLSRSALVSAPISKAPSTGPSSRPRPPTAAQITRSADSTKPHSCGVTNPCCGAYSAPPRPASSPLTPNATAFSRLVSKPNSTTRRSLCASAAHSTPSGARYSHTTAAHASTSATAAT